MDINELKSFNIPLTYYSSPSPSPSDYSDCSDTTSFPIRNSKFTTSSLQSQPQPHAYPKKVLTSIIHHLLNLLTFLAKLANWLLLPYTLAWLSILTSSSSPFNNYYYEVCGFWCKNGVLAATVNQMVLSMLAVWINRAIEKLMRVKEASSMTVVVTVHIVAGIGLLVGDVLGWCGCAEGRDRTMGPGSLFNNGRAV